MRGLDSSVCKDPALYNMTTASKLKNWLQEKTSLFLSAVTFFFKIATQSMDNLKIR